MVRPIKYSKQGAHNYSSITIPKQLKDRCIASFERVFPDYNNKTWTIIIYQMLLAFEHKHLNNTTTYNN